MSENSIKFSLSNSEQRDSWLNSSHRTLDADKKKLRTVRDHILIGESGPIAFKDQAIIRPSIEWITVLSPICSLSILLGKAFITFSIDHTLGLGIVNTTWTMQHIFGDFCIEEWL